MATQNKNTFKTTSMAVGDTVTLTISDVKDGKYGAVYVGTVNGNATEIHPSGNLKFLVDDLSTGKRKLNTAYTVTRVADKTGTSKAGKTYTSSQFTITEGGSQAGSTNNVADKLAAIRAKRAQSSNNG